MQIILATISAVMGYLASHIVSYPKSKVNLKLPKIKLKYIEVLPSLRIIIRGRIIHFHHWFNFTVLLCISIFVTSGILDSWITRGFLLGGIAQGLRFSDRNIFQKKI